MVNIRRSALHASCAVHAAAVQLVVSRFRPPPLCLVPAALQNTDR